MGDPERDEVAAKLGVSKSALASYERGDTEPNASALSAYRQEYGANVTWLLTGDGDMVDLPRPGLPAEAIVDGMVPVPLLDVRPSAGAGALVEQLGPAAAGAEIVAFREDWLRRIGVSPRHARLMVCQGDSMHDTISDGDLMIVDVGVREVASSGIYVLVYAGLVIVKRVQVLRDRSIMLKSDNPRYEPETVPFHDLTDLAVEGRVRWVGGQI